MSAPEIAEQMRRLVAAAELFHAMGVHDPRVSALRQRTQGLSQRAEQLHKLGLDAAGVARAASALERERDDATAEIMGIDDGIPMPWFREHFVRGIVPTEQLEAYARLVADNAGSSARRDRVEFVATRLMSIELADGQLEPVDEEQMLAILANVVPRETVSEATREKAVEFFAECADRLAELDSVAAVFDGGLYLDVKGYKSALEEERLDPGVLYGSVLLSIAMTNHIQRHAGDEGRSDRDVAQAQARGDAEVEGTFKTAAVDARFEAVRKKVEVQAPQRVYNPGQESRWRRPLRIAGAAIAIVGGLLLVAVNSSEVQGTLRAAPLTGLDTVSDVFVKGQLARGGGRFFLGHVDAERWNALNPEERRKVAKDLADWLAAEAVYSALVYRDGAIVIHVEDGKQILLSMDGTMKAEAKSR
jgi:hypothetical protein